MINGTSITIRPLLQTDSAFLCSIFQDNAEYYEIFFDSETSLSETKEPCIRAGLE